MTPATSRSPTTNPNGEEPGSWLATALARRARGETFTMRGLWTDVDGPAAVGVGWDDDDAGAGWMPDDGAPPVPESGGVADPAVCVGPLVRTGLVDGPDAGAGTPAPAFGPCAAPGGAPDLVVIVVVVVVVVGSAALGGTLGAPPDPKAQPSILPGDG